MPSMKNLKILAPLILSKAMKKDSPQRKRVNQFLVRQMGEIKGMWLKVGQMLALHPESWDDLKDLPVSESLPSLPHEDFQPYVEELFKAEGMNFEAIFQDIHYPGLPASLSQVHTVEDFQKKTWILKVKLPGIKEVIEDQLSLLGLFQKAEVFSSEKKHFSTSDYKKSLSDSFQRELDYDQERRNIKIMGALSERFPDATVPQTHPKIQGRDFIVMTELTGETWKEVIEDYKNEQISHLAHQLLEQSLYQYFCLGHCQGDFHPGNFFFSRLGDLTTITWLDLGQCLRPSLVERKALAHLIHHLVHGNNTELGPLFSAWSFNLEKLGPIAERLPLLLTKIFEPFITRDRFVLKDWKLKEEIDTILGEDRWWFRTAGSPDLFLSIRAWIGLFSMLEQLKTPINFNTTWLKLEKEILESIPDVALPEDKLKKISFNDMAKHLKVQTFQKGKENVQVTLPARAIEDIDSLISPTIISQMQEHGFNLKEICKKQLHQGLLPGVVVDYVDQDKRYLVTLE